ncbi:MAG: bifunctional aspartate kinase/homoserine dehydrogenase I [Treponema sp.]|nr:bifunctional aspartate kinase/homoserine dehydrogenase I [Treponema sp.]
MLVCKFGGTSVGKPEAIEQILKILKDNDHKDRVGAVVVSALSGLTDTLIDITRKAAVNERSYSGIVDALEERHLMIAGYFLNKTEKEHTETVLKGIFLQLRQLLEGIASLQELSPRTLDRVMGFGEMLSSVLLADIFTAKGLPATALDARDLVKTDDNYGKAQFLKEETYSNIREFFNARREKPLYVVTGFIGSTVHGETATLGRGGSDLSAAIFGAALGAETVEIWSDVDGILTADPRLVKNAFLIENISYIEAMELSHFGAKVLYPPTIRPSLEQGIPIWIRNTFKPLGKGTMITEEPVSGGFPVLGISSTNHVALVRIQGSGMVGVAGFSSRLFGALAQKRINIILITQSSSEYSICFAVLPSDIENAGLAIQEQFAQEIEAGVIDAPVVEQDFSIIAVVGSRMKSTPGISGKFFHALGRNGVNIVAIAQGSSELNISAVIARQDEEKALNAVHEAFFLSTVRSVNLFLIGIGLIGGTLVDQLAVHQEILADQHHVRINLAGAANSRNMIFRREGLDPKTVRSRLREGGEGILPFDLQTFIEKMKAFNLPNTAFCDCTASRDVADQYAGIIQSAIPIITPNKLANSGSFAYYKTLTGYSKDSGIPYLYETTVCAGLPVISTLRDLHLSGDRVRRIEAVLSGTLSFIFNNFDGSKPFSALVREAKAKGYTEPDPRDDLNAMDAARKALILARECGMSLEFDAVAIEPILPAACFEAAGVDAFFAELEKHDAGFESRRREAEAQGNALRYVAVIEDGSARISLRTEGPGSPFLSLKDADNIVVITSDRYSVLPMVIKGPGAGAQVTAGGVFADIVRIARTLV